MDAGGDRRGGKGCRISAVTRPLSSRRDLARLRSDVLDEGTAIEAVAGRRETHDKALLLNGASVAWPMAA